MIAKEGVDKFRKERMEVVIVDTSGRHRQERELFEEMEKIGEAVNPVRPSFLDLVSWTQRPD